MFTRHLLVLCLAFDCAGTCEAASSADRGCVWKVTAPGGGTLYLGGSWHALRSVDYPLPIEYNRAFEAADRLAFEIAPQGDFGRRFYEAGRYPFTDSLRHHIDPRTYDYLRRVYASIKVPEKDWAVYRPWFLALSLNLPTHNGLQSSLGVETYLAYRALANHKPVEGLESTREHMLVFSGLSDQQAEAVILDNLIFYSHDPNISESVAAWRRGDVESLRRFADKEYGNLPAFENRLIDDRNRNWIPKIEGYLRSHHTYFVVAGAAHMGGPNGVLALLRARGYQIEQL